MANPGRKDERDGERLHRMDIRMRERTTLPDGTRIERDLPSASGGEPETHDLDRLRFPDHNKLLHGQYGDRNGNRSGPRATPQPPSRERLRAAMRGDHTAEDSMDGAPQSAPGPKAKANETTPAMPWKKSAEALDDIGE